MKTLDEVIKAHEMCIERIRKGEDNCPADCSFISCCDPERGVLELDALHYLKEYRTLQTAYITAIADAEDNPSLTWSELKSMKGKPVWVEIVAPDNWKSWFLISGIDDSFLWVFDSKGDTHNLPRVCLDTRLWQAYRKERE